MTCKQLLTAFILTICAVLGAEETKVPGELTVKIIKESKKCDVKAEIGDHLSVHYVGRLNDENGKQFDASRDRGQTFNFQLGAGQVIQGYEQGVPGMCKGETRTLTVPSHLAYGDRGVPQAGIPGGATLHFTVELVSVTKGKLKSIHPNLHIDL